MADAVVSATGLRILKLLVGNPPFSVPELMVALGVTRTAVADQLHELTAGGFAERSIKPPKRRGRPRHLYSATPAAMLLLFANSQRMVFPAIWRALAEIGGESLTQQVRHRVARAIIEHYRPKITGTKPEERLAQLTRVLEEEGHLVEATQNGDGQLVFRKRSCPFAAMFEENRVVCSIDMDVLAQVVGAPVQRLSCRHDGAPCCSFEVARTTVSIWPSPTVQELPGEGFPAGPAAADDEETALASGAGNFGLADKPRLPNS